MISINSKYGLSPKKPAVRYKKDGTPFTCFSAADKVTGNGAPEKTYQYYNIIVWGEAIELEPSDKVFLESIEGVSTGWYLGKTQITISCRIRVVKTEGFEDMSGAEFADTFPSDVSKTSFKEEDDGIALPFDL